MRGLRVGRRPELSRMPGVFADLVVIARVHSHDDPVGRLDVLKGKLECLANRLFVITHPTGRQNLEPQTRLLDLPNDLGHPQRVGGEERLAHLDGDHRRHLFQLLGRPGNEVKACHEQIDFPALISDLPDAIGVVGGDAGEHARVVHALHEVVDLAAFAFPKQPIGDSAVLHPFLEP